MRQEVLKVSEKAKHVSSSALQLVDAIVEDLIDEAVAAARQRAASADEGRDAATTAGDVARALERRFAITRVHRELSIQEIRLLFAAIAGTAIAAMAGASLLLLLAATTPSATTTLAALVAGAALASTLVAIARATVLRLRVTRMLDRRVSGMEQLEQITVEFIEAWMSVESHLRRIASGVDGHLDDPIGNLADALVNAAVLSAPESAALRRLSTLRNRIVHEGLLLTTAEGGDAVALANQILATLRIERSRLRTAATSGG
jgi:hypothetical protein